MTQGKAATLDLHAQLQDQVMVGCMSEKLETMQEKEKALPAEFKWNSLMQSWPPNPQLEHNTATLTRTWQVQQAGPGTASSFSAHNKTPQFPIVIRNLIEIGAAGPCQAYINGL